MERLVLTIKNTNNTIGLIMYKNLELTFILIIIMFNLLPSSDNFKICTVIRDIQIHSKVLE